MTTIIGAIDSGHYIATMPSHGLTVRVPLGPIGRRVGGVEIGAICARLGTPEIGGRRWRRFRRGIKKGIRKTVRIAKTIANNKLVKNMYAAAKSFMPSPLNQMLGAIETGVRVGKAISGGSKKARAALPIIQKLAAGSISLSQSASAARRIGVKPDTVKGAAAMIKLKAEAAKRPTIARIFATAAGIEQTGKTPTRAVSSAQMKSIRRIITARSGRRYAVNIQRAS